MGAESEGGCRSDRRERRTSELKGKRGEKGDIIARIAVSEMPNRRFG